MKLTAEEISLLKSALIDIDYDASCSSARFGIVQQKIYQRRPLSYRLSFDQSKPILTTHYWDTEKQPAIEKTEKPHGLYMYVILAVPKDETSELEIYINRGNHFFTAGRQIRVKAAGEIQFSHKHDERMNSYNFCSGGFHPRGSADECDAILISEHISAYLAGIPGGLWIPSKAEGLIHNHDLFDKFILYFQFKWAPSKLDKLRDVVNKVYENFSELYLNEISKTELYLPVNRLLPSTSSKSGPGAFTDDALLVLGQSSRSPNLVHPLRKRPRLKETYLGKSLKVTQTTQSITVQSEDSISQHPFCSTNAPIVTNSLVENRQLPFPPIPNQTGLQASLVHSDQRLGENEIDDLDSSRVSAPEIFNLTSLMDMNNPLLSQNEFQEAVNQYQKPDRRLAPQWLMASTRRYTSELHFRRTHRILTQMLDPITLIQSQLLFKRALSEGCLPIPFIKSIISPFKIPT